MKPVSRRVLIIQRVCASYNAPLFDWLGQNSGYDIEVVAHSYRVPADVLGVHTAAELRRARLFTVPRSRLCFRLERFFGLTLPSFRVVLYVLSRRPSAIVIDGLSNVGTALVLCLLRAVGMLRGRLIWWSLGAVPERRVTVRSIAGDFVQRLCTRACDRVLAYSSYGKAYFERIGVREEKVLVAPNAIEISQQVAEDPGWQAGEMALMFVGTIQPAKGVDTLIRAFAVLVSDPAFVNARLLVVGDGPGLLSAKGLASDLRIAGNVEFAGRRTTDIAKWFRRSVGVVLPGRGGLAINHAFAYSRAVICGPADGTEVDLVINGENGNSSILRRRKGARAGYALVARRPARSARYGCSRTATP